MAREWLLVIAAACSGCSLFLDFSSNAVPIDAMIDAPYTQPECDYMTGNDSFDTAGMITPGADTGPAAICAPPAGPATDADFFKFAVASTTAKVTVSIAFTQRP